MINWSFKLLTGFSILAILLISSYLSFRHAAYAIRTFNLELASVFDSDRGKLTLFKIATHRAAIWAQKSLPSNSRILVFRASDFAYTTHGSFERVYSDIDPSILPLFVAEDVDATRTILSELGITHIVTPNYAIPSLYNSNLGRLLAEPAFARLVYDEGARVFAVGKQQSVKKLIAEWEFDVALLDQENWTYWSHDLQFRGKPEFLTDNRFTIAGPELFSAGISRAKNYFYSGRGLFLQPPSETSSDSYFHPLKTYLFEAEYHGSGLVNLNLSQFDELGKHIGTKFITGAINSDLTETRKLQGRFALDPGAADARLTFAIPENSVFTPLTGRLFMSDQEIPNARSRGTQAGWRVSLSKSRDAGDIYPSWGLEEDELRVKQISSRPVHVSGPAIAKTGDFELCFTASGRGIIATSVEAEIDCHTSECRILVASLGERMLGAEPTLLRFHSDNVVWDSKGRETGPFYNPLKGELRVSDQAQVRLRYEFELRRDDRFLGTRHLLGEMRLHHDTLSSCTTR